jgi:hypothetical protein
MRGNVKRRKSYHTGVRVDNQDNLSQADISRSPSLAAVMIHYILASLFIELILFIDSQIFLSAVALAASCLNQSQHFIFHANRKVKAIIHVGCLLKLTSPDEEMFTFISAMRRTRAPSDVIKLIKSFAGSAEVVI